MLSMMRNSMGKRVYKAVLWVTLISIAGTTLVAALFNRIGGRTTGVAAIVNGYKITDSALQRKKQDISAEISEMRKRLGSYADVFLKMRGFSGKPQEMAMQELVQQKLLLSASHNSGIKYISPQFIAEKINDVNFVMQYLSDLLPPQVFGGTGRLDKGALQAHLKHSGITIKDFEERLEETMTVLVFNSLFPSAIYSPVVSQTIKKLRDESEKSFLLVTLPLSEYIIRQSKEKISDQELQKFFEEQNKATHAYWSIEKRSGTVWAFDPSSYGLSVTEPELRRYYSQHLQDFEKKPFDSVKAKVEEIVLLEKFQRRFATEAKHILQGRTGGEEGLKNFEEFVQKHKATKRTLVDITRKSFEQNKDPLAAALFEILHDGQSQSLIHEGKGVLVQLDLIIPSTVRSFQDVKTQVQEDFVKEKAKKQLAEDLQKLITIAATADFEKQARDIQGSSVRMIKGLSPNSDQWKSFEKEGLPVKRMKRMIHPGYAVKQLPSIGKEQGFRLFQMILNLSVRFQK